MSWQFNRLVVGLGCTALLTAFSSPARAAVLVQYNFGVVGQETTSESSPALAATTVLAGLTATAVTDPNSAIAMEISSAATTPANAPFLRIGPGATTPAGADSAGAYYQFSLWVPGESDVDLTSLVFNVARGGGSTPRGFFVRSSADNYASVLPVTGSTALTANGIGYDVNTVRPTYTVVTADLSGTAFQDVQNQAGGTVTFRVYPYSPSAGSTVDFDDITVNGTAVVPEPGSLAVMVMGALAVLFRRR